MDGERKVEIVPDQMGGFEILGKRYEVSAATDSVIRFIDNRYDYLRYLDPEEHAITQAMNGNEITIIWHGKQRKAKIIGIEGVTVLIEMIE